MRQIHLMSLPNLPSLVSPLRRWGPLGVLACLIILTYGLGLSKYFTLEALVENRMVLDAYARDHMIAALLVYCAIYMLVVALSLPGAAILSIAGGFVFGWVLSGTITIFAATIGSVIVFQIVKTSLGTSIAERAGPFVQKLSNGFKRDAFNYLIFLRLVPAFPFFAVNAVAGLAGVDFRTYTIATFIGIIPGSFVFAWIGRGLGDVIDAKIASYNNCLASSGAVVCKLEFSTASLITPQLLVLFAALGVMALLPVLLKKWNPMK